MMPSKNNQTVINVTRPFLPPLSEFIPYLEKIWDNRILTNNGPFHQELEQKLCEYLGVKHISLFSNGTLALTTALKALDISGEVITTPFSFVATGHSLLWNGIKPVFVDIDRNTFNLDPSRIEEAITPNTTAILPVHVYGNPCDVQEIKRIADRHGLKLIYDAAHAFGVKLKGTSIVSFGDLSVLSFHAIKVFNTFEGGAVISHDEETKQRIDLLKNFGFVDETTIAAPGINAKMNELQAAMGLLQLKYIDESIAKRKIVASVYKEELKGIKGVTFIPDTPGIFSNYAYFPVFFDQALFGRTRDYVDEELKKHNIYARRYFYPLINKLSRYCDSGSMGSGQLKVAEKISREVLCLPIYPDLNADTVKYICGIIASLRD